MPNNHSARENDIDVEALDDDVEESLVADRQPRAPSITRLGRYRLVREIASGGMATVNLAVAEGLDKLVALKIIHPHLAQEENFVRMFLDEARLASAISHRNVCNVFDFGETDGRFYIAMDYLSGQSLRDLLRRLRKTDLQIEPRRLAVYVAYMIAEACEGLHAAHELHGSEGQSLNVVHRDVSPHNLFVTYDGNVSVVDFGIARASDRIQTTATGVLKGKFSYMAPEQMRQMEIDRRADIWALGVVLWESLTLQRLFVRSSQADTVMSVMMDRVRPPSEVRPDLPPELDAIALRAIARSPSHRYPTAREMGRELMKFCRESGVMVSPIEIENFMERLFEKEIVDAKQLERKAKQSSHESGVWMEVTPSGFSRVPLRSLHGEHRVRPMLTPPAERSQELAAPISSRAVQTSQTAPAAEARVTAHPEITSLPEPGKKKSHTARWVAAACALCAVLGAGAWIGRRSLRVEPLAVGPIEQAPAARATAPEPVRPGASLAMKGPAEPTPPEKPMPAAEPAPAPAPSPRPAAVAPQRFEPPRRDARGRPAARPAASNVSSTRESNNVADAAAARTVSPDELAMRGTEPTVSAPLTLPDAREEAAPPPPPSPPAPVAAVHTQPAPAPAVSPAPHQVAAKPAPAAPQRLEAQASVTELDVEGSLGSGVVARMLGRAVPVVKGCYADAAKRAGRNDFAPLSATLVIDESGAVRQVNVARHGLGDLAGCASSALKRLRSERIPDVGTVAVRFKFSFNP